MSVRGSWTPSVVFALWLSRAALHGAGADTAALVVGKRWGRELADLGIKPRRVKTAIVHHTITMLAVRWDHSTEPHDPEPLDHYRRVYFELKDGRTVSAELEAKP